MGPYYLILVVLNVQLEIPFIKDLPVGTTSLVRGGRLSLVVVRIAVFSRNFTPLELDSHFRELGDNIVQSGFLMLRLLCFQGSFQHPHKV